VSPDDNKAILHAYVETIFNQKQVDRADELVAADYVDHAALPGQAPGLEGAKKKWAMYLAGIPDLRVTIEEMVAEGDKVGVRRSYEGTHRGSCWVSRPPTGKQVRIGGISIFRLAGGKIAEHWEQLDRLALMQQLGVIPAPAAPAAPTE
jgi:predicted ester cyclase